jgi:hypothetical protein
VGGGTNITEALILPSLSRVPFHHATYMKTFFTALLTIVIILVGGVFIYQGLNPSFSIVDFYHRHVNTMEMRANADAKEYLTKILNDPDSYQPASNSVDSVFYTRAELVEQVHRYTPHAEKASYYNELVGGHKLKEINVVHFYRAKNGFGAMTLSTLNMRYSPSALEEGRLDLEPLILTNPL